MCHNHIWCHCQFTPISSCLSCTVYSPCWDWVLKINCFPIPSNLWPCQQANIPLQYPVRSHRMAYCPPYPKPKHNPKTKQTKNKQTNKHIDKQTNKHTDKQPTSKKNNKKNINKQTGLHTCELWRQSHNDSLWAEMLAAEGLNICQLRVPLVDCNNWVTELHKGTVDLVYNDLAESLSPALEKDSTST